MVIPTLSIVVLLAAVLSSKGTAGRQVSEEGLAAFNTCKAQENLSEDDLKVIRKGAVPTTTSGKCFLACMMEKSHLMKDGKYDYEQAIKMSEGTLKYKRKNLKKAKDKIKSCNSQTTNLTDRCEIAAAVAQCMKKTK